jgi:hypothetical protein
MENSQINEEQREYESTLADSQPATMPSDYELADRVMPSEWRLDFAEYLMGDSDASLMTLLAYIKVALSCEGQSPDAIDLADQQLGALVRRHFTDYLRKTKGAA